MAQCPKCGASSNGKFCAQCGAPLPIRCISCGAVITCGHRFCGECGAPAPPDLQSKAGQGSPAVNIGDIGLMRGAIDTSTNIHNTTHIGSQTNISGPMHVQISHGPSVPTAEEWFGRGLQSLQQRQYAQAVDAFAHATQRVPNYTDAFFYQAVASLQGQRPKLVSLTAVRKVEGLLQTATVLQPDCAHASLLWAIVKQDAYVMNGMYDRPPTVKELLGRVHSIALNPLEAILTLVPARGNWVWELARKMRQ